MSAENVRDHYRREGAESERKRIIALLESENCNILESCTDQVVALIKGETE